MVHQLQPLIKIELKISNRKVIVDPDLSSIDQVLRKIMACIVDTSAEIPRIEKILLPGYISSGDEYLAALSWEEDHVQYILRQAKEVVDSNQRGPQLYIRLVYSEYIHLLQNPFRESFMDVVTEEDQSWDDVENVIMIICFLHNRLF